MSAEVAITIGSFDGAHRGHAALVGAARDEVGPTGRVIVLSFDPHPLTVLRPGAAPARLTRFGQRARRLREAGADEVMTLVPTADLLARSPETFVREIVGRYAPRVIVEGPDFRFGQRRAGSVDDLRRLGRRFGFRTLCIDPVEAVLRDLSVVRVSSSLVRWLVRHGRVADAAEMLGRPYELIGEVEPGDRRGRDLGVPTCNLNVGGCLLPADGIYIGQAVRPDGWRYPAAISVGRKPTFGDRPRTCEAHLAGYDGPLDDYGWTLELHIGQWIRDQLRYDDVDALVEQLGRDIEQAATSFSPAGEPR